ncbi:IS3 family transposase [Mesobacillus zeae]|uniref:Integrase catalytic domain-containing protein n=1 Tax=Mesobacillus zeae TaxID=1917180 RepID=A0A398BKE2_9BACI|nr:IS3 family transposase [Mesobacillus zeae]RID87886.1 hypothetical protein D1970_03355 [Mesobacillus zeae]
MAKFTVEEKINAVRRYLNGNESQQTIAASIGIHKSGLQNWIKKYIEYYNHKRIKAKFKGMSPVQYRVHALDAAYLNNRV